MRVDGAPAGPGREMPVSTIECPYCGTSVNHGFTVCTGCHATFEYGPPSWIGGPLLLVGASVGIGTGSWLVFFALFLGGLLAAATVFRNRVRARR